MTQNLTQPATHKGPIVLELEMNADGPGDIRAQARAGGEEALEVRLEDHGAHGVPLRPEGEFDPKDPSLCCPVVAWLASDEAAHVSGQVIRAMGENIHLMAGWTEEITISNGGTRWDATRLGEIFATDVFRTRAPGLRMGG